MDLKRDIGLFLINNQAAAGLKKDVFLDSRPDAPDDVICIFEYQGASIDLDCERRIQIIVRNKSYAAAETKAKEISKLLDDPSDPEYNVDFDERCAVFEALHHPYKLETDSKNRTVFVCNFAVNTTSD